MVARIRLPASFFVSVAYMCWAFRRRGVVLDAEGEVVEWLYHAPGEFERDYSHAGPDLIDLGTSGASVVRLQTPLTEEAVRKLRAGDMVLLSGTVFTGRDEVHKYLYKGNDLPIIRGGVIYHCGPVVMEEDGGYRVTAAGPTTSIREEPYQASVIERFGIKAVIGKGGMGAKTLEACKQYGCVYLHGIGGAAQIYAKCIEGVDGVSLKQFGSPEAVWQLRVKDFPAVVTMDSHGRSLHQEVSDESKGRLQGVLGCADHGRLRSGGAVRGPGRPGSRPRPARGRAGRRLGVPRMGGHADDPAPARPGPHGRHGSGRQRFAGGGSSLARRHGVPGSA